MSTSGAPGSAPKHSLFSPDAIAGLEAARADARGCLDRGKPGATELLRSCELARDAVAASNAGDADRAKRLLADAIVGVRDLRLLFLAFQFHFRSGDYDAAERLARARLDACAPRSPDAARALTNLGLVHQMRGELDQAEDMQRRAIEIDRAIGDERGLARDLGNLALVPEARGELAAAETLYLEALAIAERLGALDIVATKLSNLGDIALTRGKPDEARALWRRALACFESLEDAKGVDHCAALLRGLDAPPA